MRYSGLTLADRWNPVFDSSNKLRSPPLAAPQPGGLSGETHYEMVMRQSFHDFHPKLQAIPVLTYNGSYPGPTIDAQVGVPVRVTWKNDISSNLASVLQLGLRQGMEKDHMIFKSHNVVHMHGASVPSSSDGYPKDVFHRPESAKYRYPNSQAAGTLWYHDHSMDVTRLNVYAGLFGMYFLRSGTEGTILPGGDHEIPLVLQDKSFEEFGKKLFYEQVINTKRNAKGKVKFDSAVPEFIGDYPVVNGSVWPVANLEPHIYRLRICNGANTRIFEISLAEASNNNFKIDMHVIGTEGGFLPKTEKCKRLRIAPGERYDVLIDLRDCNGKALILHNHAATPAGAVTDLCAELLKISVSGTRSDANAGALVTPPEGPVFGLTQAQVAEANDQADLIAPTVRTATLKVGPSKTKVKFRRFELVEYMIHMHTVDMAQGTGLSPTQLNKVASPTVLINGKDWHTAPPVVVGFNTYEMWEFVNMTPDAHPMHIHLIQFRIAGRRKIDIVKGNKAPNLTEPKKWTGYLGPRLAPAHVESGFKDTALCPNDHATRVIMKFDGYKGKYVYHCHILEHEDMGMMFRLKVK
jgi:spore coat protein A, manganese oxidase